MFNTEMAQLVGTTLDTLRRIRGRVENAESFDERWHLFAKALIDNIVTVSELVQEDSPVAPAAVGGLSRRLQRVSKRLDGLPACSAHFDNTGYSLWNRLRPVDRTRWDPLMVANFLDCYPPPDKGDVIISPLSAGPLLVRSTHRAVHSQATLMLAVVGSKDSSLRLPQEATWGPQLSLADARCIYILDDTVNGERTQNAVLDGLEERGISRRAVISGRILNGLSVWG